MLTTHIDNAGLRRLQFMGLHNGSPGTGIFLDLDAQPVARITCALSMTTACAQFEGYRP